MNGRSIATSAFLEGEQSCFWTCSCLVNLTVVIMNELFQACRTFVRPVTLRHMQSFAVFADTLLLGFCRCSCLVDLIVVIIMIT